MLNLYGLCRYHGTSLDAALSIQANGFDPDLAGNNAGAMLGKGIYVTSTLEKAMNYAKTKQASGVVLILKVCSQRAGTLVCQANHETLVNVLGRGWRVEPHADRL